MVKSNRPNRHSNPSNNAKRRKRKGKYIYIKKRNREVKKLLRSDG